MSEKKPIYEAAVASIQCPSANTALVHELMLLRKKMYVFLRDKLLEAWGNIHFGVKETQTTKA